MAHLIDKDALVAEIERLISNGQVKLQEFQECNYYKSSVALLVHIATCRKFLTFLDTLEVKEVNLEAEIEKWQNSFKHHPTAMGYKETAKHFFELGLQARQQ